MTLVIVQTMMPHRFCLVFREKGKIYDKSILSVYPIRHGFNSHSFDKLIREKILVSN